MNDQTLLTVEETTEARYWQAVTDRDPAFDGMFVYAVRTTGVFCRPTCPAKRALRHHVEFFATCGEAESAGYRPCLRCQPTAERSPQQDLIVRVCRYLETAPEIPTLDELAALFFVSPFHLQRMFKRAVGVSPRQYADTHRRERMKAELKQQDTVTTAFYEAGYGGSSSFYRSAAEALGMAPITYREGGIDTTITYTTARCSLGVALIAASEKGVCAIRMGDDDDALLDELRAEFPQADLQRDETALANAVAAVIAVIDGDRMTIDLPLDIRATAFQRKVWDALRAIPYGERTSYRDIAERIGQPSAVRAVANAIGANPVAIAIPCHRVVREGGALSGYRWGVDRKRALLEHEAAHQA
ncbi:MAG: bifunctional DNA-binding transcriptional regulator/O6-methylguanine-DNA methyltransferase Ada [Anaerolineae bacterium]